MKQFLSVSVLLLTFMNQVHGMNFSRIFKPFSAHKVSTNLACQKLRRTYCSSTEMTFEDACALLKIGYLDSPEVRKQKYLILQQLYHEDHNLEFAQAAKEMSQKINYAYTLIKNNAKRFEIYRNNSTNEWAEFNKDEFKEKEKGHHKYWQKIASDKLFEQWKKKKQQEEEQERIRKENLRWGIGVGLVAAAGLSFIIYTYVDHYLSNKYESDIHDAIKNNKQDMLERLMQSKYFSPLIDAHGNIIFREATLYDNHFLVEKLMHDERIDINYQMEYSTKEPMDADKTEDTPLHTAVRKGNIHIIKLLLTHPHINASISNLKVTPLQLAVQLGNYPIAEMLLNASKITIAIAPKTNNQKTSCVEEIWNSAQSIVEGKQKIQSLDEKLKSYIREYSKIPWNEIRQECLDLIVQGANINEIACPKSQSFLHSFLDLAVQALDYPMVDYLLSHGAKITAGNRPSIFYIKDRFMADIFEKHKISFEVIDSHHDDRDENIFEYMLKDGNLINPSLLEFLSTRVKHVDRHNNTQWHALALYCTKYSKQNLFQQSKTIQKIFPYKAEKNKLGNNAEFIARYVAKESAKKSWEDQINVPSCLILAEFLNQLSLSDKATQK